MFEILGTTYYFSGQGSMLYLLVYLPAIVVAVTPPKPLGRNPLWRVRLLGTANPGARGQPDDVDRKAIEATRQDLEIGEVSKSIACHTVGHGFDAPADMG